MEITEEASAGLDFELLDRRLKDRLMYMIKQQQMSFKYEALCNIWY
jgi:hypothetical protein